MMEKKGDTPLDLYETPYLTRYSQLGLLVACRHLRYNLTLCLNCFDDWIGQKIEKYHGVSVLL